MEIVNIEKQTFEEMLVRFGLLADHIKLLCEKYSSKKLGEWLDGQDVCLLLNISPRTLQTYRDCGRIGFSQINHKIYYQSSDVAKLINNNNINPKKEKNETDHKER